MNRPTAKTMVIVVAAVIVYVVLGWVALDASLVVKYDLSPPAMDISAGGLDTITDTVNMLTNVPVLAFTGFLFVLFLTRKMR